MATSASLVKWRRLAGSTPARCTPRQSHDTSAPAAVGLPAAVAYGGRHRGRLGGGPDTRRLDPAARRPGVRARHARGGLRRSGQRRLAMATAGASDAGQAARRCLAAPVLAQRRDGCAALVPVAEVAGARPGRGAPALPGQRSLGCPDAGRRRPGAERSAAGRPSFRLPTRAAAGRASGGLSAGAGPRNPGVAAGADRREAVRRGPPAGRHPGQPVLRRHPGDRAVQPEPAGLHP